jgi:hypothetical protein
MIFTITQEPRDDLYRATVDLASDVCSTFLLVLRSANLNPAGGAVLEALKPKLIKEVNASEWPGTKLKRDKARVLYFSLDAESSNLLKTAANGLYEWLQPILPEDLCFMKSDGSPYLVTISHEKDSYLVLASEERDDLARRLPKLSALLHDDSANP